jgi:BolA protein|tara:strand:+ start:361 stop:663 length:303 start_codon:yes stop_codon:yes gene_type:complete
MGSIENNIKNLLIDAFNPSVLSIDNESHMHNVPKDSESHFKIVLVSKNFTGLSEVNRHKSVYKVLEDILDSIHAISIHSFDENEYTNNPIILDSPNCANH